MNCTTRMTSPQSNTNVDLMLPDCHTDQSQWLFGMQEAIATKFEVNPQRLQIKTCVPQSNGMQLATVEIYGVPDRISTAALASKIVQTLSANATYLGAEFALSSVSLHQDKSGSSSSDGISTGAVMAIVLTVGIVSVVAAAMYFKWDEVERHLRKARRMVRTLIYGDQLDVDNDGTSYGDGHAGAMHKANLEITYQLDGAADAEEDEHIPVSSPVHQMKVDQFHDPDADEESNPVQQPMHNPVVSIPEQRPIAKEDAAPHSGL